MFMLSIQSHKVVSELAKYKRTLILEIGDNGSKLIGLENATCQTWNNYGVIKFK